MGEDRLNEFLKNSVEQHRTPVDGNAMWAAIEAKQQVEEKSRKRAFWWWFLGALLLVVLITVGIYFVENQSGIKDKLPKENVVLEEAKPIPIDEKNAGNQIEVAAKSTDEISKKSTVFKSEIANQQDIENQIRPSNVYAEQLIKGVTSSNLLNNEETSTATQNAHSPSEISEINTLATSSEDNFLNNKVAIKSIYRLEPHPISTLKNEMEFPTSLMRDLSDFNEDTPSLKTPPIKVNTSKKWYPSIGIYGNYGWNKKTLTIQNDGSSNYQQLRENTESTINNIRAGLDFKWQHHSGLYGKIGLEYAQINEKLTAFTTHTNTYIAPNQVVQIITNPDGSTIEIFDSAYVTDIVEIDKTTYNRYRTIDVPILLGYEMKHGDKWRFFVETGVAINVSFKMKGEILNESMTVYNLQTDNENWFKDNTGIAFLGGIGISYQLNKHWNVWASPAIKFYPNSWSTRSNPINQKYQNFGIGVGLGYEF